MGRFGLCIFLAISTLCCFGQVGFEQHTVIDSSYSVPRGNAIASGDIDGDGFIDLSIAGSGFSGWARSIDGEGSFETVTPFLSGFYNSVNTAIGDLDGDEDLDVLLMTRVEDDNVELLYFENIDGTGAFADPVVIGLTSGSLRLQLYILDLDNDGDEDIVYSGTSKIAWLENDGQASFTETIIEDANHTFHILDMNGDGLMDFIMRDGSDLKGYTLTADGTLDYLGWLHSGTYSKDLESGDMDGDGDIDYVSYYANGNNVRMEWFENLDGEGTFSDDQLFFDLPQGVGGNNYGFEIGDMDNDDLPDIIIWSNSANGVSWYKNLGGGSFGPRQILTESVEWLTWIELSDLDGDGNLDIIFTDFELSEFSWIRNINGEGDFTEILRLSSYAYFLNAVDYGDLDGDGDLDLVSSSSFDHKVMWYENVDGFGFFPRVHHLIATGIDLPRGAQIVDLDNDSDQDVLLYQYLDFTTDDFVILWFENDGNANFTQHEIFSTQESILGIRHGDVDGDGDEDIIIAGANQVLGTIENNGDGTFESPDIFSQVGFSFIRFFEVIDLDGDDDLDVIATYQNGEKIWHENDGTGNLTERNTIADDSSLEIYAVADIVGDEHPELIFVTSFTDELGYYSFDESENNFGNPVILADIIPEFEGLHCFDPDLDGDSDIAIRSTTTPHLNLMLNDGEGNFTDPVQIDIFNPNSGYTGSADINGDGFPDLITSSINSEEIAWFENLGVPFTNAITGFVRLDADADDCDTEDAGIGNLLIQTANSTNTFATFTQSDGSYSLQASAESFTTTIQSPLPNYYSGNPDSHVFDFTGAEGVSFEADFCVQADSEIDDLAVVVYPDIDEPRPGFETSYLIVFENNGTTTLSGTLEFHFDESKLSFDSASEPVSIENSGFLEFEYSDLLPFETRTIGLNFTVFPPPTTNIDDIISSTVSISPSLGDVNEADNSFTLDQVVIGSYDPNDIRVLEGEEITIEQAEEYLHYIIRFQNTGTASAINVRVNNLLDPLLDWSTIELQSMSHPGTVEITDGNAVDFIFNDINLPDSTSDEPNSHGYITYKIKPVAGAEVGDIYSATANIYFDFNPPIITNTATTEIVMPTSVNDETEISLSIFPNPSDAEINVRSDSNIEWMWIFDINGRLLMTKSVFDRSAVVDVSSLSSGLYFIRFNTELGPVATKFIKK